MSKHVGEKRENGQTETRTDGESDGRRPGRTSPYHQSSRLKTDVYKK